MKLTPLRAQRRMSASTPPPGTLDMSSNWPALFGPPRSVYKAPNENDANASPQLLSASAKKRKARAKNLNVYLHRSFGSDVVRVVSKKAPEADVESPPPFIPGWRRVGNWIDVGDGWLPWRLNNGFILVEPIVYVFHPKIVEMGAKLNVRAVASSDGAVLDIVDGTTEFKAVAMQDGWLKVKWPMGSGEIDDKDREDDRSDEAERNRLGSGNGGYVFAWVLMHTEQYELLVPKPSPTNWLVQEALDAKEEGDSLSDTSSPSGSPLSFHDTYISPLRLGNINDERPLPTTLKRRKTRSMSEDSMGCTLGDDGNASPTANTHQGK